MDLSEFLDWQEFMGYNNVDAAKKLGVTVHSISKYRQGYSITPTISKYCDLLRDMKEKIE